MKTPPKELGQRTKAELEELFGSMYSGWDRGVVVTQERFGDGETRFAERPMTAMELGARFVAAEIGANIYEIAGRAAFAPIITFSHIQIHLGPVFESMEAQIKDLRKLLAQSQDHHLKYRGEADFEIEHLRSQVEQIRTSTIEECARAAKDAIWSAPKVEGYRDVIRDPSRGDFVRAVHAAFKTLPSTEGR